VRYTVAGSALCNFLCSLHEAAVKAATPSHAPWQRDTKSFLKAVRRSKAKGARGNFVGAKVTDDVVELLHCSSVAEDATKVLAKAPREQRGRNPRVRIDV
jgi:hypothetical protein